MATNAKVASVEEGNLMKAAYITQYCDVGCVPESISFGKIAAPDAPKKNEVLISVKAASINVDDCPLLQDTAAGGWGYHTRKPTVDKPVVGGMDYAGVVLACGPDCKTLKVGDRVCGLIKVAEYQAGTWAEQTLAPENDVCLIGDDSISFVDAAAVVMGAFVDFDMIKHAEKELSAGGFRCLVIGASGALGSVMLQILRKYKGHVTAICSGANAEKVREMGADEVIDYTQGPFGEQLAKGEKFSVVYDFVGGKDVQSQSAKVMEKGAMYITAVGDRQYMSCDKKLSCGEFMGSVCFMLKHSCCCCCSGPYKYVMSGAYPPLKEEMWKEVVLGESGARALIAEEVPFSEEPLRKALKRAASHHSGGRIVINLEKQ